jgi:hypothetical protein
VGYPQDADDSRARPAVNARNEAVEGWALNPRLSVDADRDGTVK